ncbi:MAG: GerMN domain-containing protein [Clostridia bacterium]|nr:GerMN domain-containing protein [Clostridia bacterium]
MLKRGFARRALLAIWLLAAGLALGGCVRQISESEMIDLSQKAIEPSAEAPKQDGAQSREELLTLYFLDADGVTLRPVTRRVNVQGGASRAQAALDALLAGPLEDERGVIWPDLGASRSGRLLEVSGGVATVDLSAHARTLAQQTLYAVRLAIANTLTEFSEISYVNVLVGGREEGLDLSATLPVGTLTHTDDPDVSARYNRLHEQRLSGEGVTLMTTLYFPAADGRMILPEVRNIAYAQVSPIEYLYTILGELGKGASLSLCAREIPAPLEYIEEMPEIVRTEDGYLAIELCFDMQLEEDLARNGMTLGVYMAMLSDTLMGFVPGVEGLKVSVGERDIEALLPQETPDGRGIEFEHSLATRSDFAGYVGAPAALYVMRENGLARVQRVMEQSRAGDMRARLEALMAMSDEGEFALPQGLAPEDVLAVHAGADVISVNLSAAFMRAMQALSPEEERAAVYAMVNTLTEGAQASRVEFFFEGEQVSALAGALEMRGAFVRNPGMVVN